MSHVSSLYSTVANDRRVLHQIPEIGLQEYKTSHYIKSVLNELQVEFESFGDTGVLAYFKGLNPTKTLAFRTDIDALPVTEESDYPNPSTHEGYMHACGHDGHMSMMLGLARYLSLESTQVIDNILLIFQPAEEGPGGAEEMVKQGVLSRYRVDEIYGIHVFPDVEQGYIGVRAGAMMAMTGEFDIDIYAKSAHGAMPQTGVDGIVIASEIILGLQTVVSRSISPIQPAVLTVGKMTAGERRNIIAGKARLEGTIRAFDKSVFEQLKSRMRTYLKGMELAYDVRIELETRDMYPPVVNDHRLHSEFVSIFKESVIEIDPQMISEDFSFYQEQVPGLFYFIGTRNTEKGYVYPLHNAKFNFDDTILIHGLETYRSVLLHKNSIVEK